MRGTFSYNGDVFPMPPGWDRLPVEEWFARIEHLRQQLTRTTDPGGVLLREEGFTSGHHFEAFRRWSQTIRTTNLEPVAGVSCEQWAQIAAALVHGAQIDLVLASCGVDRPTWRVVDAEWHARMRSDRTRTIASIYGAAIDGKPAPTPVPFERYCEVEVALACACEQGEDAAQVLQTFAITGVEWSEVSMFWRTKMAQDALAYDQLRTEYHAKYRARYSSSDMDEAKTVPKP